MNEVVLIILVSFYGVACTVLFICTVLACRIQYSPIEEN